MKFTPRNIKKFQQGGPMPAESPEAQMAGEEATMEAPQEPAPQENPLMMLGEGAAQALQNQDCQIAMQVCEGLLQLLQQMSGPAPQEPQGEPVFRKGGILSRRIKK